MEETFRSRIDGHDPGANTVAGRGGMPEGLDWVALVRRSKPMVAAINGAAIGIGITMCLPMDQIVVAPGAKLGMGFIKVGLVPELASTRLLADRVGFGRASDLCLSGRVISGEEAARIGLADRISDDVVAAAIEVAESYAANPSPQLLMTKHLLGPSESELAEIQANEHELLVRCWASREHAEAVEAFRERRSPSFSRSAPQ